MPRTSDSGSVCTTTPFLNIKLLLVALAVAVAMADSFEEKKDSAFVFFCGDCQKLTEVKVKQFWIEMKKKLSAHMTLNFDIIR